MRFLRFCLFLLALFLPGHLFAQTVEPPSFPATQISLAAPKEDSFVMTADTVSYDDNLQIVTASGNVEIVQDPYVLLAQTVSYNEKTGIVSASGSVRLMQPSGDVLFSDYMELTGDMKNGFLNNIGLLLNDNSRLAADSASRSGGNLMTLHKVVYSPCNLCKENPREPPLWQLKARKVEHDKIEKKLKYYDARLEMGGFPVFYAPYFSHPDPSVKRKSGFLAPSFTTNNDLGVFIRNYYYWALAPNYDLTTEVSYATNQGPLIGAEWRQRFSKGFFNINGTLAISDLQTQTETKEKLRGNFFARGQVDINSRWRGGYDGGYASDPSYLRFYRISPIDIIRNRLYTERFQGRDYAVINAYAFQDLRPNRPGDQPNVLPQGTVSFFGDPGKTLGGRWQAGMDILSIVRPGKAQDVQRTAFDLAWQRRLVSKTGLVTIVDMDSQAHFYSVQNAGISTFDPLTGNDYTALRAYPEIQIKSSLPFAKTFDESTAMIEPIIALTALPRVKNSKIPNEDSQDFELDATNLFALNRYPGLDRIDDSNRVTYGIQGAYDQNDGFFSRIFFGQSYNLNRLRQVTLNSGLEDDFSDYIGEIQFTPASYWDTQYRVRLDHDDMTPRQHEVRFNIGPAWLRSSGTYVMADQLASDSLTSSRRQQMVLDTTAKITDQWSFRVYDTRNLGQDSGALVSGAVLQYQDECFAFQILGQRDYTQRIGVDNGDTIYFQLTFKNLGDFSSPTFSPNLLSSGNMASTTSLYQ